MREAFFFGAVLFSIAGTASAQEHPSERMTLDEAVGSALRRNPNVASAVANVRRAEALMREARSGSYPTLTANAAYTRLDDDRRLGGRVISAANQFNANLTLTVPLFSLQRWATWSHAEEAAHIAEISLEEARRGVAVATARAYLAIVAQNRVIGISERARDTAKAHLDFAHQRFTGGVGTRLDEVRAGQELYAAEAQVESAHAGLARAREALSVMVGAENEVDVAGEPAFPTSGGGDSPADIEARRTDIRRDRARLQAADRIVRDNWKDYSPTLLGQVMPFYQTPATLTVPETGWQAQLLLTLPIYDGGLRSGQAQEREAGLSEARAALDSTTRQARADVRAAIEASTRADRAMEAARKGAELSHQALELANIAYRAGATTNLEVIDAERRARDADSSAVLAEDASRQARLDLLVATGRFPLFAKDTSR
jgi:outer membrane protein